MSLTPTQQLDLYRRMLRIRLFEEAVSKSKELGAHLSIGQEAAIVGACAVLRDNDYVTGTHRSHGHPIAKGADLKPLMAELWGKKTGVCKGRGGSMHLADGRLGMIGESAIVGGGLPLAVGAGLSIKVRRTDQVSLCFFGDGAANQGTFGESLNLAAIWRLPVIFFCENNQYAISTSVRQSHGQPDIAMRAEGYGLPGLIVDGQEVETVYAEVERAVGRARADRGPTLIEAKTYRFDEHCSDLVVSIPYRPREEIERYKAERDPLVLYQSLLSERGVTESEMRRIERQVADEVAQAIRFAEESPLPDADDVFDFMFSNPIHYPPRRVP